MADNIDLTDVETAQSWIPGSATSSVDPDILQMLITSVSRDIVRMVGAKVDYTAGSPTYGYSTLNWVIAFTLTLDGNGSDVLFPPVRPIRTLTALQINGYSPVINPAYGQAGVAIETDGYSLAYQGGFGNSGTSTTVGWPALACTGVFPMGRRNILLTCTAGYGVEVAGSNPVTYTAPDDLQVAALQTIAHNYMRRDRVGLDSENVQGNAATTYSKIAYPLEALAILTKYTRVPLGSQA